MGLELAPNSTISELVETNPTATDPVNQGDDHSRLIKRVIKNTFKNGDGEDGTGWDRPLDTPVSVLNNMYTQISADDDGLIIVPESSNITAKYLEIGEAGAITYQEPIVPVGSITQSVLTQAEINAIYGANVFALCDGQNIQDSRLFVLTGLTNTPNMLPDNGASLLTRQALVDSRTGTGGLGLGFGKGENSSEIGTVKAFGVSGDQDGFFECDGRVLTIEDYPDLFDVIGTSFGSDDAGQFTFYIPDLRGRFIRGHSNASTTLDPDRNERAVMNPGGAEDNNVGSIQGDAFRSHTHTYTRSIPGAIYTTSPSTLSSSSTVSTFTSSGSGGNETRPVNAYMSFQIRYRSIFETQSTLVTGGVDKYIGLNHFIRIN